MYSNTFCCFFESTSFFSRVAFNYQLKNRKHHFSSRKAALQFEKWALGHRPECHNSVELELKKGSFHLKQIGWQSMESVSMDHWEMVSLKGYSRSDKTNREIPGSEVLAAKLCSAGLDGVALLAQLDGNESDWWRVRGFWRRQTKQMCSPLLSVSLFYHLLECFIFYFFKFLFLSQNIWKDECIGEDQGWSYVGANGCPPCSNQQYSIKTKAIFFLVDTNNNNSPLPPKCSSSAPFWD